MVIAGIDPGKRGAIVILDTKTTKASHVKLTYSKEGILTNDLNTELSRVDQVYIEKIKGRGGWGANSVFQMGFYFGQVVIELEKTSIPYEFVLPEVWTRRLHADVDVKGGPKVKSLAAYLHHFPHDPIGKTKGKDGYHDGLIDALLIASYSLLREDKRLRKWHFK